MYTILWSMKAGVGVSTTAALYALSLSSRAEATLLVDLVGDQPAVLGLADPSGPGVGDWVASGTGEPEALRRISTAVTHDLALVHHSIGWEAGVASLSDALMAQPGHVVVDVGVPAEAARLKLIQHAPTNLLVVRPCYLCLRRCRNLTATPDGVVLVREPGRALSAADVEAVTGAPIVADIAVDPAIARSVDAGLSTSRLPRGLRRSFVDLARRLEPASR